MWNLLVFLFPLQVLLGKTYIRAWLVVVLFFLLWQVMKSPGIQKGLWRVLRSWEGVLVLSFFVLLFVTGVVLAGNFYENQREFFQVFPAYFFLFVLGMWLTKKAKVLRWFIYGILASLIYLFFLLFKGMLLKGVISYITGPFGHYITLGMYIEIGLLILLVSLFCYTGRYRWLWVPGIPLLFIGVFFLVASMARGAWISFAFGLLLVMFCVLKRRPSNWRKKIGGFFLLLMVLSIVPIFHLHHNKAFLPRLRRLERFDLSGRPKIWRNDLRIIKTHPMTGLGIAKGQEYHGHQQILQIGILAGVAPMIFFVAMILLFLFVYRGAIFSVWGIVLLMVLFHNLVEAALLVGLEIAPLFWFILGSFVGEGRRLKMAGLR